MVDPTIRGTKPYLLLYNQQLFVTAIIADCRGALARSIYGRSAENRVLGPDAYARKYRDRSRVELVLLKNYTSTIAA